MDNILTADVQNVPVATSVNKVPSDILAYIFILLSHGYSWYLHERLRWDWIVVAKVCRYWRSVAIGYPAIWSNLRSFYNLKRTELLLKMSKDADLKFRFSFRKSSFDNDDFKHVEAVLRHMHRISHLYFYSYPSGRLSRSIQDLIAQPAPRLKVLSFHPMKHVDPYATPNVPLLIPSFSTTTIQLRELVLFDVHIPMNYHLLRNLSQLTLDRVRNLTSSELLKILKRCPELEQLTINNTFIREQSWEPVRLPLLYELQISGNYYDVCARLISNLILPACIDWNVSCRLSSTLSEAVEKGLFPDLFAKQLHARKIEVLMTYSDLEIKTEGFSSNGGAINIAIQLTWGPDTPHSLHPTHFYPQIGDLVKSTHLKGAKMVYLMLFWDPDEGPLIDENTWFSLLTAWPSSQYLEIYFAYGNTDSENAKEFLRSLVLHRIPSSDDKSKFLFSQLSHLSLGHTELSREALLVLEQSLRERKRIGYGIKKLSICGSQKVKGEFIDRLSDCVDELLWSRDVEFFGPDSDEDG